MSKQQEADLILKLYDLRREAKMREAREWFFREFHPESAAEVAEGNYNPYLRMVLSYWDMAASLVNHGAIAVEFFNDANGEHFPVFAKVEPFLQELRVIMNSPKFLSNLEALIDKTPNGRKIIAETRERMKAIRAQAAGREAAKARV
jgi:hypothetical protein